MSSQAWRKNKIALAGGGYHYRCSYQHTNGRQCNKEVYIYQYARQNGCDITEYDPSSVMNALCKQHLRRLPSSN